MDALGLKLTTSAPHINRIVFQSPDLEFTDLLTAFFAGRKSVRKVQFADLCRTARRPVLMATVRAGNKNSIQDNSLDRVNIAHV